MAYHVAFWNLENLFAPEGFADREPWIASALASDLRGWTEELFQQKIAQLESIVVQLDEARGPDLLGVCEAENRFVLEALVSELNATLPERHYDIVHADNTRDKRGIDTAFIYDTRVFSVAPDSVFSHFVMRRTGTRDITQATFSTVGVTPSASTVTCSVPRVTSARSTGMGCGWNAQNARPANPPSATNPKIHLPADIVTPSSS